VESAKWIFTPEFQSSQTKTYYKERKRGKKELKVKKEDQMQKENRKSLKQMTHPKTKPRELKVPFPITKPGGEMERNTRLLLKEKKDIRP